MKKRVLFTVLLLFILVLKYFVSACPLLPEDFYGGRMYLDDLNFHYRELNDPLARAMIWLDCYLSLPYAGSPLPHTTSAAAGISFGREGSGTIWIAESNFCGIISLVSGDEQKAFVTVPGLGESLRYLIRDLMHAEAASAEGGDSA